MLLENTVRIYIGLIDLNETRKTKKNKKKTEKKLFCLSFDISYLYF